MVTPMMHRKWAREYLARAEQAQSHSRKCRYLKLAVSNTVCAHKLAEMEQGEAEDESTRPADDPPTSQR